MLWQGDPGEFYWLPWYTRKAPAEAQRVSLEALSRALILEASNRALIRVVTGTFAAMGSIVGRRAAKASGATAAWLMWFGTVLIVGVVFVALSSLHDLLAMRLLRLGAPEEVPGILVPIYSRRPKLWLRWTLSIAWLAVAFAVFYLTIS